MHNAFECVPILERLPLQIESIATAGMSEIDVQFRRLVSVGKF